MKLETAFSMETSSIKYGPGVTREVGWDMEEQGAHRVMVVTDTNLRDKEPVCRYDLSRCICIRTVVPRAACAIKSQ